jgi:hypothetical protein
MTSTLGRIAILGLGVGVVSLTLAYAFGGPDLSRLLERRTFLAQSCDSGTATKDGASERHLAWDGGDTIDIAAFATVRFVGGTGTDIVLRGSPGVIANVEVRGGRLALNCHSDSALRDIEITLPGRAFRRVRLSGATNLVMENVNQPNLTLDISGSGRVQAKGTVDRLTIHVSGSGRALLGELAMKELAVRISGSGKIEAAPKEAADIQISGAGNVRLLSRPARLTSHVSGSGRIDQGPFESAEGKR